MRFVIDCDFDNDALTCPRCGFRAKAKTWRRNCPMAPPDKGAGRHLHDLFTSMGVKACALCSDLAREMDSKGVEWCRANHDYIVERIKQNAGGLSWREWFLATGAAALAGYATIGQMVDEAIRRAEAK